MSMPSRSRVIWKTLRKTLTIAKLAEKFESYLHNEANWMYLCECVFAFDCLIV